MRSKLNRTSSVLGILSVLLIGTTLFAAPFPFVRAIWIREVWGITGLIHAFFFILISNRISKGSLPAPLAGVGLVLNYEILTILGFIYVCAHRGAQFKDGLFFAGSLFLGLLLILLFGDIFKSLYLFRLQKKLKITSPAYEEDVLKQHDETDTSALIISAVGYLVIFIVLYKVLSLDETFQYGVLKTLTVFISPLSFGGIGQEIDYYMQGKQSRFFCIIKSLSHALTLACVLWIIYHRLSPASVII